MGSDSLRHKNGQTLEFKYSTTANNIWREDDELVLQQLMAAIGIKLDIQNYPASTFFSTFLTDGKPGTYDIAEFENALSYDADDYSVLACSQIPPAGFNITFYCNKQLDSLYAQEESTLDPAQRQATFNQTSTSPFLRIRPLASNLSHVIFDLLLTYLYIITRTQCKPNSLQPKMHTGHLGKREFSRYHMDAVQFGRWMSEQRRKHGWRSQRSLVETVRSNPLLSTYNISEDFLARLEAGQLAHPFRGSVRRRVLALAWLLCTTPRDLRTYLRVAELTDLNASETECLNGLNERLATRPTSIWMSLPPRPIRLIGRAALLNELTGTLSHLASGLCAITGMPGAGKSALAYEAVHHLVSNEQKHLRLFLNGIVTFSGTGRRGTGGLIALLNDIIAVFSSPAKPASRAKHAHFVNTSYAPASSDADIIQAGADEADLAGTINRTRLALSNKRVLILLDDVDARFPLRQALEALLAHSQSSSDSHGAYETGRSHCVVLITSRYVPSPSLVTHHFHVEPLDPLAALELFTTLAGRSLAHEERGYAEQICSIVGYLPLAIEMAATAVTAKGIPISLLAAQLSEHPLDTVLDGER